MHKLQLRCRHTRSPARWRPRCDPLHSSGSPTTLRQRNFSSARFGRAHTFTPVPRARTFVHPQDPHPHSFCTPAQSPVGAATPTTHSHHPLRPRNGFTARCPDDIINEVTSSDLAPLLCPAQSSHFHIEGIPFQGVLRFLLGVRSWKPAQADFMI